MFRTDITRNPYILLLEKLFIFKLLPDKMIRRKHDIIFYKKDLLGKITREHIGDVCIKETDTL